MNLERVTKEFLQGLGEAEGYFKPSPFQLQAIEALRKGRDVIVVAPTGSGKTWIAQEVIREYLEDGKRCWYTTPLKALSNQKFDQFRHLFGEEKVGLLTGERKENPSAPLIVATTEVLRNSLYSGESAPAFVVLDEAHYISDPDRGVTWEEVIILAPKSIQFLLLSATISNPQDICDWMAQIRERPPELVICEERPVPLRFGFVTPSGHVLPLDGGISPDLIVGKFDPVQLVDTLNHRRLLPAIIFLPRRRDCDRAARAFRRIKAEGEAERERIVDQLACEYPELYSHPLLDALVQAGIASHHAGHLTSWKILVERLLSSGLIRAVFSTSTLAAGLDVPARTVVLPELTLKGVLEPLSPLDFHQMIGRAGRRGKDKVGFALMQARSIRGIRMARALATSKPQHLRSAFRVQYYQVLNLLDKYGYWGALDLLSKSLLVYQQSSYGHKKGKKVERRLMNDFDRRSRILMELGYLNRDCKLTQEGEWAKEVRHANSIFITESIRRGWVAKMGVAELCAWATALSGEKAPSRLISKINLDYLLTIGKKIAKLERKWGVQFSPFLTELVRERRRYSPAERRAAVGICLARGEEWKNVVNWSGLEPGDLQRMLLQAVEVLRQIEGLPLQFPNVRKARSLLSRYPLYE